jgi:quinolinate synthase
MAILSSRLSLTAKIRTLAEQQDAVILAHNYQVKEVQDIADYLGDSLELSQRATKIDAAVIVFCGVHFMAETASILSPEKTVLTPEVTAGCPMANMITPNQLRTLKAEHPGVPVITYVNSTAEVKAESYFCCTSSNAVKVVESVKEPEVIFIPDKYLAAYVGRESKKTIIPWAGYCPTHVKILPQDIQRQKMLHPKAEVMVHPECIPPVIELADKVLSTGGMCQYAQESKMSELIVGTEIGLLHRLRKENPKKIFYPASDQAICPNMKKVTLEKVLWALQEMKWIVKIPDDIRERAKRALDRMIDIS